MPDIGLTELIIIGLVLFLVVGPERLPEFFGQVAGMVRKAKEWINETKRMVKQEADALRTPIIQTRDVMQDEIKHVADDVTGGLGREVDELHKAGQALKEGRLSDVLMEDISAGEEAGESKGRDNGKASAQSRKKTGGTE